MINIEEFTKAVFEELRLLGESVKFDSLDLTPDEQFARSCEQFPIPAIDHAKAVLEEVFWASLLTEEGRSSRPRLIYSPRSRDRGHATHWLEKPLSLTRDSLRKLTPTQGPLGYLIWDHKFGAAEITGVEGRQGGDVCDFTIAAPNYGALNVNWHCLRIIAMRAGRVDRRSKEFLPDTSRALEFVRQLLESFDPAYLGHTIRAITKEGHGGAIWMLREGCVLDGIQIGHVTQRRDPPSREKYEQRFKWLESVGNLAAVDGAVLLDSCLHVLGFGCFIDVPDSPREVACLIGMNNIETRSSNTLGGGRHRSAIEFCCRFAPAVAIVVSEDGRISIMWAAPANPPFWAPLSILGFSNDLI